MLKLTDKKVILWLFLFIVTVYALVASGHYGGDALNNYLTTASMILDKDLSIYDREFPVQEIRVAGSQGVLGKDGKRYSPFGIGMPFLQTPLFLVGLAISKAFKAPPQGYITFFCVSFTNTVLSAINTVLLFMLMMHLDFRKRNAVILSLIYSFSTTAIVYSKTGFSEPGIVTFMLIAILSLYSYFRNRKSAYLIISGVALGFMGLIKSYTVILWPVFAVYFLINEKNKRINIWIPVLSCAAVFSIELWMNYLRFGGILRSGYAGGLAAERLGESQFGGSVLAVGLAYGGHFFKALYYYWLSSGKGFFFYSPVLLLGLFSFRSFFLRKKKEFWLIFSIILAYALYFAYFFKRGSIFSWGPRYLFPITPLFILFMEGLFKKKVFIILMIVIVLVGIFVQLPALIMNYSHYLNFVIERLKVEEYLVNFVPDLSPVKGCWHLLWSAIFNTQHTFVYSPDAMFVKPVSSVMSGYNEVDLWYVNLIKYNAGLRSLAVLSVILLCVFAVFSVLNLFRIMRRNYGLLEE